MIKDSGACFFVSVNIGGIVNSNLRTIQHNERIRKSLKWNKRDFQENIGSKAKQGWSWIIRHHHALSIFTHIIPAVVWAWSFIIIFSTTEKKTQISKYLFFDRFGIKQKSSVTVSYIRLFLSYWMFNIIKKNQTLYNSSFW